jgi:hypothetical protein
MRLQGEVGAEVMYQPLKERVRKVGGIRLAMHPQLRDQLTEAAVLEWPAGCDADKIFDVLSARLRIRARKKYGSVIAVILLSAFINALVRIVIDWWMERDSHRVLMTGWNIRAKEAEALHAGGKD